MDLIVIESPNKIKKLREILGSRYRILATVGHFRDLPSKGLSVDTVNMEATYEVAADRVKMVEELKEAAAKAERIILASDPDREGEAISWHVAQILSIENPLRAEFHEITKAAVTKAIEKPRALNVALVEAQQARRILDRLVGYILSPELRPLGNKLSAGRVQSCVLHLICKREAERGKFSVRKYWTLSTLYTNGLTASLADVGDDGKLKLVQFESEELASVVVAELRTVAHLVAGVEGSEVQRKPKPPFETSSLLKAAGIAFGWKADRTTRAAQDLFEAGHITYPRTDSLNVAAEAQAAAREVLEKRFPNAVPYKPPVYRSKSGAQEAHECIRPSHVEDEMPGGLTGDQVELYGLVWRRFLASQARAALFAKTLVNIDAGQRRLRAIGMRLVEPGFLAIGDVAEDDSENDDKELPPVTLGETLIVSEVKADAKKTNPPPRYKEATLIEEMKRLGIGRPSTYSSTLKVLFNRNYIASETKKKNPALYPTELGTGVDAFLALGVPEVLEPDYTAAMEESLDAIAAEEQNRRSFLLGWYHDFETKLTSARERWRTQRMTQPSDSGNVAAEEVKPCPKCAAPMRKREGKFGAFWGCTRYPECKSTINDGSAPRASGAESNPAGPIDPSAPACPQCQQPMRQRNGPTGPFWGCSKYPACKGTRKYTPTSGEAAVPAGAAVPKEMAVRAPKAPAQRTERKSPAQKSAPQGITSSNVREMEPPELPPLPEDDGYLPPMDEEPPEPPPFPDDL